MRRAAWVPSVDSRSTRAVPSAEGGTMGSAAIIRHPVRRGGQVLDRDKRPRGLAGRQGRARNGPPVTWYSLPDGGPGRQLPGGCEPVAGGVSR
jgi:hypothetical protein